MDSEKAGRGMGDKMMGDGEKTTGGAQETPTGKLQTETVQRPSLAQHDSTVLDLAFAMDCTGMMV